MRELMLSKKITKFYEGACCVALLATAFSFSGCSDDDIPEANLPNPGDPVLFGVSTSSTGSRTHYEEPHGNKIPINWNLNDSIRIYSDYAKTQDNSNNSTYWVNQVGTGEHKYHAQISGYPDSTKALRWQTSINNYTFWGAYPKERVVNFDQTTSKMTMEYYTNQTCGVSLDQNATSGSRIYKCHPDMKNAYMMARNTVAPNDGQHILLAFDPIMTTLKVHITAGKYEMGTGIIQPITVTGISVVLPNYLQGGQLDYNMVENTKEGTLSKKNGLTNVTAGSTEPVFVSLNNDGKRYLDMLEGDQLELMAFLPPMDGMENAILKVHTVGGFNFQKKLTAEVVKQGYIDIKLPDITPQHVTSNNWISQLPDKMKIFDMSIPGFDFKHAPNSIEAVSRLTSLLKKGVRVFDLTPFVTRTTGNYSNFASQFPLEIAEVLRTFITSNPKEFVFIINSNPGNLVWDKRFELDDFLQKKFSSTNPPEWKDCPISTTTIADLRGKLVVGEYWNSGIGQVKENKTANFAHDKGTSIGLLSAQSWRLYYGDGSISNEYGKVVNEIEQTGSYGIVTIPGLANSNGFSNTDLLVQALIDCNFKFRSTKP